MNSFGTYYRLTSFGESHGPAIGGIIDGGPAGIAIDMEAVRTAMERRSPRNTSGSTGRREADTVEFLSGIYEGRTLGTPIGFIIRNTDSRPQDYPAADGPLRPNHADYTYLCRYGIRDPRGGGRASARETACRVVAGAIAAAILADKGIAVHAWTESIGTVSACVPDGSIPSDDDIFSSPVRCPQPDKSREMEAALDRARRDSDTLGGIVRCVVTGLPAGIGDPVGDKLQARLAAAMMSIPAAKGFDYGDGFAAAAMRGSEHCDLFTTGADGSIRTATNHSGGIQGGISNGAPVAMRVAFKPIASMPGREVSTVDASGRPCTLRLSGRHDVCAVPRAVSVVRAMAAMTILDALLAPR